MRKLNITKPINNIRGEQLKDEKGKKLTAGDVILNILSRNFKTKESREAFWTTELGIQISNAKDKIELSREKWEFLERVISENKSYELGREEVILAPFILGQLMSLFKE